jgi:hypothetical protein
MVNSIYKCNIVRVKVIIFCNKVTLLLAFLIFILLGG